MTNEPLDFWIETIDLINHLLDLQISRSLTEYEYYLFESANEALEKYYKIQSFLMDKDIKEREFNDNGDNRNSDNGTPEST